MAAREPAPRRVRRTSRMIGRGAHASECKCMDVVASDEEGSEKGDLLLGAGTLRYLVPFGGNSIVGRKQGRLRSRSLGSRSSLVESQELAESGVLCPEYPKLCFCLKQPSATFTVLRKTCHARSISTLWRCANCTTTEARRPGSLVRPWTLSVGFARRLQHSGKPEAPGPRLRQRAESP
jgi:hypothetical protein